MRKIKELKRKIINDMYDLKLSETGELRQLDNDFKIISDRHNQDINDVFKASLRIKTFFVHQEIKGNK